MKETVKSSQQQQNPQKFQAAPSPGHWQRQQEIFLQTSRFNLLQRTINQKCSQLNCQENILYIIKEQQPTLLQFFPSCFLYPSPQKFQQKIRKNVRFQTIPKNGKKTLLVNYRSIVWCLLYRTSWSVLKIVILLWKTEYGFRCSTGELANKCGTKVFC